MAGRFARIIVTPITGGRPDLSGTYWRREDAGFWTWGSPFGGLCTVNAVADLGDGTGASIVWANSEPLVDAVAAASSAYWVGLDALNAASDDRAVAVRKKWRCYRATGLFIALNLQGISTEIVLSNTRIRVLEDLPKLTASVISPIIVGSFTITSAPTCSWDRTIAGFDDVTSVL